MTAHGSAPEFHRNYAPSHPRLREAARLADEGQFAPAIRLLREFLNKHPNDAHALYLLAGIARRQGRMDRALALWAQCVGAAPDFKPARYDYAEALLDLFRADTALVHVEALLQREPRSPEYRALKARALEALDDYNAAAEIWRSLTDEHPERSDYWVRYGYVLRGLGQFDACVASFRRVVAQQPESGGAWWNLSDIKPFRFGESDIAQMENLIAKPELPPSERACLHFALAKAHADLCRYQTSFGHYAKGNALQHLSLPYDANMLTAYVARSKRAFSREFFLKHSNSGHRARDPIFIVGMMRAGSTLVEQILASHSQIEGTRELKEIPAISQHLQQLAKEKGRDYPAMLDDIEPDVILSLGDKYLENAKMHRRLGRPFFIDKMGANFVHAGLIHLLFPNARIIDVRRHPLACGFSIFTQYFPKGGNNTWRLADIGRNYRDYVELMAHFDRVLPGRVFRVFYENLVAEPENVIRHLLDHLELPFEESCLQFHATERAIATISAEQVRQPLHRNAIEYWRNYEPWLGPLKAALGPVLPAYPSVPEELF